MNSTVRLSWIVAVAGALLGGAGCFEQDPGPCLVGRADGHPYAAKYTPVSSGGTCTPEQTARLSAERNELLFMNKYISPDASVNRVAIRPESFVKLGPNGPEPGRADENHDPIAVGDLDQVFVPEDGICGVPTFSEARQDVPEIKTYQFSSARFLSSAVYRGTSMGAQLVYTEGSCQVTYEVSALWPGDTSCEVDADCNPEQAVMADYDTFCYRYPAPTVEDPSQMAGRCLMRKPFPSLKDG